MELGFFLHFYQPSNQLESVFRDIVDQTYQPLLKLIQSFKTAKFTVNLPLSFLAQLDKYGYHSWISAVKELYEQERIELVGSGAYHPLMTKLPTKFMDQQIILNEYSLGYYLGQHKGFEGEPCIMLKDVKGFFPPEMAVNKDVVRTIEGLGYDWVLVDELAITEEALKTARFFKLKGCKTTLVVRDRTLSNMIAFNRGFEHKDVIQEVLTGKGSKIVALDAETFGHHNKEGIYMLEALMMELYERGHRICSLSELGADEDTQEIDDVIESTWSTNVMLYPMWQLPGNQIQRALWELFGLIHVALTGLGDYNAQSDLSLFGVENNEHVKLWDEDALKIITDPIAKQIRLLVITAMLEQSDQFWWASGVEIMNEKKFSRFMVESSLRYYTQVTELLGDETLRLKVEEAETGIKSLLNQVQ